MSMNPSAEDRCRRRRRSVRWTLAVGVCLLLIAVGWAYGPGYLAYSRYVPEEGDILFQSLPHCPLVDAIEGATESPFSHCGIVARRGDEWVVYEAYQSVAATSLRSFVFRGRSCGFAVYRLKADRREHIPATLDNVRSYVGRPYDARYRLDDERIYCSELIYKAYRDASGGEQLGKLVRLGDLPWQAHRETIERYEGGPVPQDRELITPRDLARAEPLELVMVHAIEVERAEGDGGRRE